MECMDLTVRCNAVIVQIAPCVTRLMALVQEDVCQVIRNHYALRVNILQLENAGCSSLNKTAIS